MTSKAEYEQMDEMHRRFSDEQCFELITLAIRCPEVLRAEDIAQFTDNETLIAMRLWMEKQVRGRFTEAEIDMVYPHVKAQAEALGVAYEIPAPQDEQDVNDVPHTTVQEIVAAMHLYGKGRGGRV